MIVPVGNRFDELQYTRYQTTMEDALNGRREGTHTHFGEDGRRKTEDGLDVLAGEVG